MAQAQRASDAEAPRRRGVSRLVVAAVCTLIAFAALAGLGELLLPSLAEHRLRQALSANSEGVTVRVAAEPGLKLLFGHADRVDVRIRQMRSGRGHLGDLLARTGHTDRLDATVGQLVTHGLQVTDVSLRKRGRVLTARATVTRQAIADALPSWVRLREQAAGRNALAFSASARALGHTVRATVLVRADGGRLLLEPKSPVGALLHLTLFADPRTTIDAISSKTLQNGRYVFTAQGHLTS
jgi:hypothetical protein